MYQIEKNVPMPESRERGKYPFADMEIGDSVFIPKPTGSLSMILARLAPKKFIRKSVDGGTRVWRSE